MVELNNKIRNLKALKFEIEHELGFIPQNFDSIV
jgi:hypothetical protein